MNQSRKPIIKLDKVEFTYEDNTTLMYENLIAFTSLQAVVGYTILVLLVGMIGGALLANACS